MHIHHSVLDADQTGKNIFSGPGRVAKRKRFYHFIAGMQTTLPGRGGRLAPMLNSYPALRQRPRRADPIWNGRDNRHHGHPRPLFGPVVARVGENRLAGDGDLQPLPRISASLALRLSRN